MKNGHKRVIAGLAGLAIVGGTAFVPSSPAQAEPSIDDVQKKVDHLYHEAEIANERYHNAKERIAELRGELSNLRADEKRQHDALGGVKTQLRDSVLEQFEGSTTSQVGQVLSADDPQEFLSGLTSVSTLNTLQSDLIKDFDSQVTGLQLRRDATLERVEEVETLEKDLKKSKDQIDSKVDEAEDLLGDLKAEAAAAARANPTSRSAARDLVDGSASGSAKAAIDFAMSQIGKPYVYGATGPGSYDCSGLMAAAWGSVGVSLPRTSSSQYGAGSPVSESELQPGDLVFYYSPISHVGMYIGNGTIVHAGNPGTGVETTSLHSMPYVGARRVG